MVFIDDSILRIVFVIETTIFLINKTDKKVMFFKRVLIQKSFPIRLCVCVCFNNCKFFTEPILLSIRDCCVTYWVIFLKLHRKQANIFCIIWLNILQDTDGNCYINYFMHNIFIWFTNYTVFKSNWALKNLYCG